MEDLKNKLQDEITTLERELHVDLPREIARARALGDLSENAEYHSAKERQSFVDARLSQVKGRMRDLMMVDFSKIPHDKVGLGSEVLVFDLKKDEEVRYKLVTSEEADAAKGMISTTSPIGRGLIGKMVGDSVRIVIPGGAKELEILKLSTIHDLA